MERVSRARTRMPKRERGGRTFRARAEHADELVAPAHADDLALVSTESVLQLADLAGGRRALVLRDEHPAFDRVLALDDRLRARGLYESARASR